MAIDRQRTHMAKPTRNKPESQKAPARDVAPDTEKELSALKQELASLKAERKAERDGWFQPLVLSVLFLGLFGVAFVKYGAPRRPTPAPAPAADTATGEYNPPPTPPSPPAPTPPAPPPTPPSAPSAPSPSAPAPGPTLAAADAGAAPEDAPSSGAMDIPSALQAVYPAAVACAHGLIGIHVRVTYLPTGLVGDVEIGGARDQPMRDCITRAVRARRVHAFEGSAVQGTFRI